MDGMTSADRSVEPAAGRSVWEAVPRGRGGIPHAEAFDMGNSEGPFFPGSSGASLTLGARALRPG